MRRAVREWDNSRTRAIVIPILVAVAAAGCGGGSSVRLGTNPSTPSAATATAPGQQDYTNYYPPGTHRAARAAVRAIEGWSDQLRAGHVERATDWFALPVVIENASPPMRLTTRHQVFEFNDTLPCGAHVVKTIAGSRYTVATFVLTERPRAHGRCGATGQLAATAFVLRHGKIAEWRRVLVPPPLGPATNMEPGGPIPAS